MYETVHNSFIFSSPKLKQSKCLLIGEKINKLLYIHTRKTTETNNMDGWLSHAVCWVKEADTKANIYFLYWEFRLLDGDNSQNGG